MGIFDKRLVYYPFAYPEAQEFARTQRALEWNHQDISMAGDISDWKEKLTDSDKNVIGSILNGGFTPLETIIGDFWVQVVGNRLKTPEIQRACAIIAGMEAEHSDAYANLNLTLGLTDFESFLQEPTSKAKIDRLTSVKGKSRDDFIRALAVFSAFNEGVSLFSSFAVLMSFSTRNLMKGLGETVAYSVRDESLHSNFGCWIFRTAIKEYPELKTDKLKDDIYEAARLTVELEDDCIEQIFSKGSIEGINPSDLMQFIRHRTNTKLGDLGYGTNWKNIDKEAVSRITSWFDVMTAGDSKQDFFSGRETRYSKGRNFDEIWTGDWK